MHVTYGLPQTRGGQREAEGRGPRLTASGRMCITAPRPPPSGSSLLPPHPLPSPHLLPIPCSLSLRVPPATRPYGDLFLDTGTAALSMISGSDSQGDGNPIQNNAELTEPIDTNPYHIPAIF